MGARPSVWLLSAALLLAAGGLLWIGLRPAAPAPPDAPEPPSAPPPAALEGQGPSRPEAASPAPRPAEPPAPPPSRSGGGESRVPHEVVRGAGGESAGADHRLLVLAVDPHLPTSELERLLRDLREAHRDRAVLDVRVYDSREAAETSLERYRRDGGVRRARHRIAELRRNDRLGLDVVRIRGVEVEL